MTTDRRAVAQRNKRRQEIKQRLTLNVEWQAQLKTGEWQALKLGMKEGWLAWGEKWDCGRRGLGYLSIVCTPCRRRVFNSTPRAGLGFLRDSNIQQLCQWGCIQMSSLQSWTTEVDRSFTFTVNPFFRNSISMLTSLSPTGHVYCIISLELSSLDKQQQNGSVQSHHADQGSSFWKCGAYLINIPWLGSSSNWILPPSGVRR